VKKVAGFTGSKLVKTCTGRLISGTFPSEIAGKKMDEGTDIVNDISGGWMRINSLSVKLRYIYFNT
jgi:hypothetical protein